MTSKSKSIQKSKDKGATVHQELSLRSEHLSIHQGPLPAPEQLAQYDSICSGLADRIVKMAESQIQHRQELEKKAVYTNANNARLGVIFAFIICIAAIASGTYVIVSGHEILGFAEYIIAISSLIGVFVYGKKANQKELIEKQKLMNQIPK